MGKELTFARHFTVYSVAIKAGHTDNLGKFNIFGRLEMTHKVTQPKPTKGSATAKFTACNLVDNLVYI